MENDAMVKRAAQWRMWVALAWLPVWGGVVAMLAVSLKANINPWHVTLADPDKGKSWPSWSYSARPPEPRLDEATCHPASLSPDESRLAIARLDGTVELRDLSDRRLVDVVEAGARPERLDFSINKWIHLLADDAGVLALRGSPPRLEILQAGGQAVAGPTHERVHGALVLSDRRRVVSVTGRGLFLADLRTGAMRALVEREVPDEAMVELALGAGDRIVACAIDDGTVYVEAIEAEGGPSWTDRLSVPDDTGAGIAEGAASRSSGAAANLVYLSDLAVSPDGRYLAVGYAARRVRLYDAVSGEEVWDREASGSRLEHIVFSPDGDNLLFTSSYARRGGKVRLMGIERRDSKTFAQLPGPGLGALPAGDTRCQWMPDGREFIVYGSEMWLVDATGHCLPMSLRTGHHLDRSPPDVVQVIPAGGGSRLIEVTKGRAVRVWQRHAEASPWGAFRRVEAWGIVLAAGAAVLGLVALVGRSRRTQPGDRALRRTCFVLAGVSAAVLAAVVIDHAAGWLWSYPDLLWSYPGPVAVSLAAALVLTLVLGPVALARAAPGATMVGLVFVAGFGVGLARAIWILGRMVMGGPASPLTPADGLLGMRIGPMLGFGLAAVLATGLAAAVVVVLLLIRVRKVPRCS